MRAVLVDGVPVDADAAAIPLSDRGVLYGDAVVETMRAYAGEPFALEEHVARLFRSAELVRLRPPAGPGTLADEVRRALASSGLGDAVVRVAFTRGSAPLLAELASCVAPRRIVAVDRLALPPRERYRDGVSAIVVHAARATEGPWGSGAKVGNYLVNLLALDDARRRGAEEALFADANGGIREAATSNFVLVSRGALVTAPESAGILAGITRAHVLDLARAAGVAIEERVPAREDLARADEAFTCASIREVVPVVRIEGATIGDGRPGPLTRALHAALRARAGASGPMPWEA